MYLSSGKKPGTTWAVVTMLAMLILGSSISSQNTFAQNYSCFPTCSTTDGRFLSIAGAGISTMSGTTLMIGVATAPGVDSVEIGIFDGETGGYWDIGTTPVEFTLFADPYGVGATLIQIAQWSGTIMPDNAWFTRKIKNVTSAKSPNGNFIYTLRVRSTNALATSSSSFKVRTTGSLQIQGLQAFDIIAALPNVQSAQVIYPNYPSLNQTTYDGTWDIYVDVPTYMRALAIWDGDMDFGSYDGSVKDSDDDDTPNTRLQTWSIGTEATYEGIASGNPGTNASGANNGVRTSGAPCDNERRPLFNRGNAITYTITDPAGNNFTNNNPSGNKEWEQFRLSTAAFNRSQMDHHVDSLPPGAYRIRINGMDMGNLNAWRFFHDVIGSTDTTSPVPGSGPMAPLAFAGRDSSGNPTKVLRPFQLSGIVWYDTDGDGVKDANEMILPGIAVTVKLDANNDGFIDNTYRLTTDSTGRYTAANLICGKYYTYVDTMNLMRSARPTVDPDGVFTPNRSTIRLDAITTLLLTTLNGQNYGYRKTSGPGTATRGYWYNHEENWPVGGLWLGCKYYTKDECLDILATSTSGDNTYSLAAQLIAAKLNVFNGNASSCISADITAADQWLCNHPVGDGCTTSEWNQIVGTHTDLDDYNNGDACAPHIN